MGRRIAVVLLAIACLVLLPAAPAFSSQAVVTVVITDSGAAEPAPAEPEAEPAPEPVRVVDVIDAEPAASLTPQEPDGRMLLALLLAAGALLGFLVPTPRRRRL